MSTPAPDVPRRILLVDADAFFVAVARQEDPEGAGKATLLIVGGRPGSRGVVCSASYECRAYGVRSAMPISRALKLCPQAMCVPVPRHVCGTRSREIQAVLAQFAPVVQPSSIDEWYCDLGGTEALYGHEPLEETARRMREAVFAATGLRVSIGGGTSRLVAKMAVEVAKPKPGTGATGVRCVPPGTEAEFLSRFKLADLPMVGPRFATKLERMGLETIAQAQQWTEDTLVHRLGDRAGQWLSRRIRGQDESIVRPRDRQKQVSRETTFGRNLHEDDVVERELLRLAVRVSADLRRQALRARTITVKLRDGDFRTRSAQRTLSGFIESEHSVVRAAKPLLRQMRKTRRAPVRLLGIALSHFEDDEEPRPAVQLGLFPSAFKGPGASPPDADGSALSDEPTETPRDRALVQALDRIRGRFGADAIIPARLVDPSRDTGPRVEE
ncbi:MAG TPA: DNA polymerase IV [Gemmatimonas aurantiaca]|uniref:DNA polymerase IV n=2 Tax=Gemmatimonas aurantiaca TaxID=173480 RepID=C1A9Y5_GEMAT|nr:DNA polymerase IV [Gemmatimonas aurantiaca]BAH39583.1 DNA polymerase IV [Gemmatimonas aurantiaca T-27]HCT58407.1 DNA polymerase IV [Gemmatimonas aurantiaca]